MAARGKAGPRPEDILLDGALCLRVVADNAPKVYWRLLSSIGFFASRLAPTVRERDLAKQVRATASRQSKLIGLVDDEQQAWLRRQLDGPEKEADEP